MVGRRPPPNLSSFPPLSYAAALAVAPPSGAAAPPPAAAAAAPKPPLGSSPSPPGAAATDPAAWMADLAAGGPDPAATAADLAAVARAPSAPSQAATAAATPPPAAVAAAAMQEQAAGAGTAAVGQATVGASRRLLAAAKGKAVDSGPDFVAAGGMPPVPYTGLGMPPSLLPVDASSSTAAATSTDPFLTAQTQAVAAVERIRAATLAWERELATANALYCRASEVRDDFVLDEITRGLASAPAPAALVATPPASTAPPTSTAPTCHLPPRFPGDYCCATCGHGAHYRATCGTGVYACATRGPRALACATRGPGAFYRATRDLVTTPCAAGAPGFRCSLCRAGAGDTVVSVDSPFGRLGLTVCYDLRFPELYQILRFKHQAQVLLVPSAFTKVTGEAHWEILLRARAIETQCYVIAAAQAGKHNEKRESYGDSIIIDPWGTVIARLPDRLSTGFAAVVLDLSKVEAVRTRMPISEHRKFDSVRNSSSL
ncbi:hypothetical protein PR202_gb23639 [Eleusine coracana subsp. coracana]|uniref:CN hydrolase domain-containing protein n=2 Tax=Magnoliopsida TaxID=3398 RepID=A0AAV5FJN5_ELECO|nr:hypothetical protein PR202_gb23639 [Eleusine coracana subsp. coracana]